MFMAALITSLTYYSDPDRSEFFKMTRAACDTSRKPRQASLFGNELMEFQSKGIAVNYDKLKRIAREITEYWLKKFPIFINRIKEIATLYRDKIVASKPVNVFKESIKSAVDYMDFDPGKFTPETSVSRDNLFEGFEI